MQRRHFIKAAGAIATIPVLGCTSQAPVQAETSADKKEIYEWRIYTLSGDGTAMDAFFKDLLIPAYNKKGIIVGAYKLLKEGEEDKRYYQFIYPDITTYYTCKTSIWADDAFRQAAQPYFDAAFQNPAYSDLETYLTVAFDKMPTHRKPDPDRGLFEFRLYKARTEEGNQQKIKMFNMEEIDLFDKVGVNSICYGDVLAGPNSPSLIYLTWSKNEETRNAAWAEFSASPDWQRIRTSTDYANSSTRNTVVLLAPLAYSQL